MICVLDLVLEKYELFVYCAKKLSINQDIYITFHVTLNLNRMIETSLKWKNFMYCTINMILLLLYEKLHSYLLNARIHHQIMITFADAAKVVYFDIFMRKNVCRVKCS